MSDGAATAEGQIRLDISGTVAEITIDRANKLNAIGPGLLAELERTVSEVDSRRDVWAVVVTGAGDRAFCVGADVHAWAALDPLDMWRTWVREGHRVLDRLATLRQPTIAAVNGMAFGGGLELALATDFRIAADSATFAAPEVRIGTLPGWGGTSRLPDAIGMARAKQMIFTGERIDASTAERWGLVNDVVVAAKLRPRALELANQIVANAPVAVQLAKASLDRRDPALEAMAGALAAGTGDGREGIASFRERRGAVFTGE
ncbi:MAG: enoyl-CoA hydratase-related protein [Thermomicrobiales bacterium]